MTDKLKHVFFKETYKTLPLFYHNNKLVLFEEKEVNPEIKDIVAKLDIDWGNMPGTIHIPEYDVNSISLKPNKPTSKISFYEDKS